MTSQPHQAKIQSNGPDGCSTSGRKRQLCSSTRLRSTRRSMHLCQVHCQDRNGLHRPQAYGSFAVGCVRVRLSCGTCWVCTVRHDICTHPLGNHSHLVVIGGYLNALEIAIAGFYDLDTRIAYRCLSWHLRGRVSLYSVLFRGGA